jgi:prepilin-type N-terminal cleavage/methylation domain-containing protein
MNRIRQTGVSLIEVMVTLAVVAFGILGIVYLQGELSSQSASNKARAEAVALAEARIEEMRNYTLLATNVADDETPFENFPAYIKSIANIAETATCNAGENIDGVNATYNRRTCVNSPDNVDVIVSWNDRNGNSK